MPSEIADTIVIGAGVIGLAIARLIYPLPGITGLGTHVTKDLAGQFRFGPDTE